MRPCTIDEARGAAKGHGLAVATRRHCPLRFSTTQSALAEGRTERRSFLGGMTLAAPSRHAGTVEDNTSRVSTSSSMGQPVMAGPTIPSQSVERWRS
jgi:hypothetical protein